METENKLGVMPVSQLVLSMTVPIMISMLAQSMYNIVDSIFVSRISEDALTAASLAYSAQMLQIAVAVGTGAAVARYHVSYRYVCDAENPVFYAEDGVLYRRDDGQHAF